jgi:hypothetical protein
MCRNERIIKNICKQINRITSKLIEVSLSVSQNFPASRENEVVTWSGQTDISFALKNVSYVEIYEEFLKYDNYNIQMLDGALIQIMYKVKEGELLSHRLAFYPCPDLERYQDNPIDYEELYFGEGIYGDVVSRQISAFPLRFDYDPENHVKIEHPRSHLTLGQYKNCRIPVISPITPGDFIKFILRSFYYNAFDEHLRGFQFSTGEVDFDKTITTQEKEILHLSIKK